MDFDTIIWYQGPTINFIIEIGKRPLLAYGYWLRRDDPLAGRG